MNLDQVMNKCQTDLDEILSSIEAIKGSKFCQILALHINYTTLISLISMLDDDQCDTDLHQMLRRTSVLCASESLATLCAYNKMSGNEVKELVDWGDRLQEIITNNLKLLKESE